MSKFKYSRLPTSDQTVEFSALDGPSYFSYAVDQKKYKSAFTYTNLPSSSEYGEEEREEMPPPSVLCRVCSIVVTVLCYVAFVLSLPVSAWFAVKNVQHYERVVLFRLGRLSAALGPGYIVVLPCIDRWIKVDLRMKAFSVPPQKVITADSATIEIGADVFFRVKDAVPSVTNVQDLNHSTRIICQTLLQKHIGKQILGDIESDRAGIANALQVDVNQMTQTWGVEVSRIELSAVKVHSQPNPLLAGGAANPLSVLGPVLFPPGNSNAPVEQLKNFYQLSSGGGLPPGMDRMLTNPEDSAILKAQYEAAMTAGGYNAGATSETAGSKCGLRTAGDMIKAVRLFLSHSLVHEFNCVYKFVVTDEVGGTNVYHLDLKHGEGRADVGEPVDGNVDVTLTLTSNLLRDLLAERITAFNAYMTGQLSISGDLKAAMKLSKLFESVNRSLQAASAAGGGWKTA